MLQHLSPQQLVILATGSALALVLALSALYLILRGTKKEPKPIPKVYDAVAKSTRRLAKKQHASFATNVEVAPEMAQLRDGFGKIRTAQEIFASLSPDLKEALEPVMADVSEKHLAQILSNMLQSTEKLQELELRRQLELEVGIIENESLIANVAEQIRLAKRLETLLLTKAPELETPVGQAVSQAVTFTLVQQHLDKLNVTSDLRQKVLAPLQRFEMLETAKDEPDDDDRMKIHIANLSDDQDGKSSESPEIYVEEREP